MSDAVPAHPRLSATVLLIRDDPFQVLMIRRRAGDSFGSALVFPGGLVDAEDRDEAWCDRLASGAELPVEARALRIAALRELYEEAGLMAGVAEAAVACVAGTAYGDALGSARLDLAALVPFSHWITPVHVPRRFDTHFFLCPAPLGSEAVCDGAEAVALEWASPAELLARAERDAKALLFPTRMNLMQLAESRSVADAIATARARPVMPVVPEVEQRDGGILHRLPADAGYAVREIFIPR